MAGVCAKGARVLANDRRWSSLKGEMSFYTTLCAVSRFHKLVVRGMSARATGGVQVGSRAARARLWASTLAELKAFADALGERRKFIGEASSGPEQMWPRTVLRITSFLAQ